MRKNMVIEQNRCYHLVSRLAHRAFFLDDEYFQVGRTDICDTPYAETVKALRELGEFLGGLLVIVKILSE